MSEDRDTSKSYPGDESALGSVPIKFKDSSCALVNSDSDIPFVNRPATTDSKDGFIPRDEVFAYFFDFDACFFFWRLVVVVTLNRDLPLKPFFCRG